MIQTIRKYAVDPLYSMRNGLSPFYWKRLDALSRQPVEVWEKRRSDRLAALLAFASRNNPYYRRVGTGSILTKEAIRSAGDDLISDGYKKEDLLHFKTGGSTGTALELYLTHEASARRNAVARHFDQWTGWAIGEPVGMAWGNPDRNGSVKAALRTWLLLPWVTWDTMNVTDDSVRQFDQNWRRAKPTLLFGHAHSLFVLAQMVERLAMKNIRPKGVITSSMTLLPHERREIERVFGVAVFDRYGCEEVSLIAAECERHEGYHVNVEHLIVEIIKDNGEPAGPGEPGFVVVTDLFNYAMPLIRYRVDDIAVASNKTCSCGRTWPLLQSITGRTADFLVKPDESRVAGVSLIENTLTRIPGIRQMQIVQETISKIVLNVVPGSGYSKQSALSLIAYFKSVFGEGADVSINSVSDIPREPNGKYRFSICRVGRPDHL